MSVKAAVPENDEEDEEDGDNDGKREGDSGGKWIVGREKEPDKRSKKGASPEAGTKVERRSINAPVV